MSPSRVLARVTAGHGYSVRGVQLSTRQRDDFYLGFAHQVIWPLFHDFQTQCDFNPRFWETYVQVNRKFARVVDRLPGTSAPSRRADSNR